MDESPARRQKCDMMCSAARCSPIPTGAKNCLRAMWTRSVRHRLSGSLRQTSSSRRPPTMRRQPAPAMRRTAPSSHARCNGSRNSARRRRRPAGMNFAIYAAQRAIKIMRKTKRARRHCNAAARSQNKYDMHNYMSNGSTPDAQARGVAVKFGVEATPGISQGAELRRRDLCRRRQAHQPAHSRHRHREHGRSDRASAQSRKSSAARRRSSFSAAARSAMETAYWLS